MKITPGSKAYILALTMAKDFIENKNLSVTQLAAKYKTNKGNISRTMNGIIAARELALGDRTLMNLQEFQDIEDCKKNKTIKD